MVKNLCVIIVPMSWFLAGKGGSYGTRYWGLVTYERGPQEPLGHFLRKFKRKALKKIKIQGEISHFQKISWKTCFFCLENASKKESRESLTSLAKVSLKLSDGHRKFQWNFRQTFVKLSHDSFFDAFFRQKNHVLQLFFFKKMRNFTLDFIKKKVFAWIFFKRWLFPWFVQTMFSFLLKLSPRS